MVHKPGRIKSGERGKIQSYWDQQTVQKRTVKNIIYRLQLLTMLLMSTRRAAEIKTIAKIFFRKNYK
jgi:hypothetical protein